MRLPRRVPWESLSELDQVCSLIYADENDIDAKVQAVNRISAWRAITSLPHALESTLALLCAILDDSRRQGLPSLLSLRQSYATALIRLVNGLVDPLQVGAYARSIASIAAQLGLPAWLVELRHAATHEDLPSIDVLREAAREAMRWLLDNYFLPTLNPSAAAPSPKTVLRPLSPLLKQYKTLLKGTTRDASLLPTRKHEIAKVTRDIERWVAEAKVAANVSVDAIEWDIGAQDDSMEDGRERWALERLCDALLELGALVPVSKKKRTISGVPLAPAPANLAIWTPLLTNLQSLHPKLPAVLAVRIVSHLLSRSGPSQADVGADTVSLLPQDDAQMDTSYDRCLAGWANWLVDTCGAGAEEEEQEMLRRDDIVVSLITGLGPQREASKTDIMVAQDLLTALCAGHPHLERVAASLPPIADAPSNQWNSTDIDLMQQRLSAVLALARAPDAPSSSATGALGAQPPNITNPMEPVCTGLPPGWRLLSEKDGWRPSPIGVHVPRVPA
ncbi:Las1-domain-containing protein [Sparassis crispa]|uniref:Las1-domain-containing protein n=1 Tax=Sparassis crispa TaxID=139825 RepID=A0A401G8H3_9APHY|nr:Las1-domain-containing protein [Sparassis crispa]GBE78457.1 Las1-domain-containing protein [Sparassis crispa]